MHPSVQRWLQSMKASFRGRLADWAPRAKPTAQRREQTLLGLEPLEDRSMLAITAVDNGSELLVTTTTANNNITMSASGGVVTLSSTSEQINAAPQVGGVWSVSFNLADFDFITILPGGVDANIFGSVEIVGSAAFANETIYAGGANVSLTGGPLSVNGLRLSSQLLGAPLVVDQQINSTGGVYLHPYSGSIVLNAPIVAPGQTVSLIGGYLQTNLFTVSQSAAGFIVADSVYAEAGGGVDLSAANQVSKIAGKVNAFGFLVSDPNAVPGDFKFNSTLDLTVTSLLTGRPASPPIAGVTTTNGNVFISAGAGKTITVDEDVTAGGAGKTLTLAGDAFSFNPAKAVTGETVVLKTAGAGVNMTLGGGGLTNAALDVVVSKNLTFDASGTITVSGAMTFGDDASEVVALKAAAVNVANGISANASTGVLRFETNSLFLNGAVSKSVSAPQVEIAANIDIQFNNTFNAGGMDFTSNELGALDETLVQTLRFITSNSIFFADVTTDFSNGAIMKSGGEVVLNAMGSISQASNGAVAAERLALVGSTVVLNDPDNSVGVVSGKGFFGDFLFTSNKSLVIGSVDDPGSVSRGVGGTGISALGFSVPGIADVRSGGALTQTADGKVTAGELLAMGTTIDLSTAANTVRVFAALTSGAALAAGDVRYKNTLQNLLIGTVNGVSGVHAAAAPGAPGTLANVTIVNDFDVTLDQAIDGGAGLKAGTVLLTTTGGNVYQTAGGVVSASALGVDAVGRIELDQATSNVSTFAARTDTNFGVYFKNDSGGTLTIGTVGALSGIKSSSSTTLVGINTDDDLVVAQAIQASGGGRLFHIGLASQNGSVSQTAAGKLEATAVTAIAETNVALDVATNNAALLQVHTDAAGNIKFNNDSANLQIASASLRNVGSVSGITSGSSATNVSITNTGDLAVSYYIQSDAAGRLGTVQLASTNASVSQIFFSPAVPGRIQADALAVQAEVDITLDAVDNRVLTLAMDTDAAGSMKFKNDTGSTPLVVGTVGALSGITSDSSAATVSVVTVGELAVQQPIQKNGGGQLAQVLLTSTNSGVTQNAAGKIEAAGLGVTAAGDVHLEMATNDVSTLAMSLAGGTAFVKNDSGGTLTIGTVGALSGLKATLDTGSFSINTADDVVVDQAIQKTGGGQLGIVGFLSQDGSVSQTATGKIEAQALIVLAQTNVALDVATNNVSELAISTDAAGDVKLKNDSANLGVTSIGFANIGAADGIVSASSATNVTISNTGNLILASPIQKSGGGRLGTVQLASANGAVTQTTGGSVGGKIEAAALGVQAENNITLDVFDNDVGTLAMLADAAGTMKFKNDSGATLTIGTVGSVVGVCSGSASTNVNLTTSDDLSLQQAISTTGGGRLNQVLLTSVDGDVKQAATGAVSAGALGVSGKGAIELDGATNDVGTLAMALSQGYARFKNDSGGGALSIGTVGTLSGLAAASGSTSFEIQTADDLAVDQAIQKSGGGRLSFVALTSVDGALSQSASGKIEAFYLLATAQTNVALDVAANNVDGIAMDTDAAGAIRFKNDAASLYVGTFNGSFASASGIASDSAVTNVVVANTGGLQVYGPIQKSGGGRLGSVQLVSSGGEVVQGALGVVAAASLGVQAASNITLDVATNDVGTFAAKTTTGNVAFKDGGAGLTIGVVDMSASLGAGKSLTGIVSDSSASTVSVTAAADVSIEAPIGASADGSLASVMVVSTGGAVAQKATIVRGTTVTMSADSKFELQGGGTIAGQTISLSGGSNVTVGGTVGGTGTDSVKLASGGGLSVGGTVTTKTADLDAGATLSISGGLTAAVLADLDASAIVINGSLDVAGGTADLTAAGVILLNGNLQADVAKLKAGANINLASLTATTSADVDAGGTINVTGLTAPVTTLKAGAGISVTGGLDASTSAKLEAGAGISVSGGVIAGTADLQAGDGIGITGSVTTTTSAKLVAGDWISLGGLLSAGTTADLAANGGDLSIAGALKADVLTATVSDNFILGGSGSVTAKTSASFTTGAAIQIQGVVTAPTTQLDSGTNLVISGSVTAATLADLDAVGLIAIGGSLKAATLADLDAGNGIMVLGLLDATGGAADLTTTGGDVSVASTGALKGATLKIDSAAGVSIAGTTTADSTIDAAAAGGFTLSGALSAGTSAALSSGGGFTLSGTAKTGSSAEIKSGGGFTLSGELDAGATALLTADGGFTLSGKAMAGTSADLSSGGGFSLSGELTSPIAKVASGASLSVDGTLTAADSATLSAVDSIGVGGEIATFQFAATAGQDVTISNAGRVDVGLGDGAIDAGGTVSLVGGGTLGLVVASAVSYSNVAIQADAVNLSGGVIDVDFLNAAATIPALGGQPLVLVVSNVADVGIPTIRFLDAGVPAPVVSDSPTLPSAVLGGQVVTFIATFGSNVILTTLPTPPEPPPATLSINTPLTVPAQTINVPPPIQQTVPAPETDFFYGQQSDLASLTVYVKLYRLLNGKKEWVLGSAMVDDEGRVVEVPESFKGDEVLSKLISVLTDAIAGKWGVYTLELEEVAPAIDGGADAPKTTRTVKATFVFNVKTRQELIQALRNIQTLETLFQYFQELPHRSSTPPVPDGEQSDGPAARRPRPAAPAQGEGASFFDALRDRSAETARLLREAELLDAPPATASEEALPASKADPSAGELVAGAATAAIGFQGLQRRNDRFEQELDSVMEGFEELPVRWN